MEIIKCQFAFFTTVISFLCSDTTDYGALRIRQDFKTFKAEMAYIREDISALFEKTNRLNISAIEACGPCTSGNKTSCLQVTSQGGRQDTVKVNSTNVLVKYQNLIKAFVSEKKKINRELQDQLRSMEDTFSASGIVANERGSEQQSRLLSVEDIISDIRNNMTLINRARELMDNERHREQQSRLQSIEDNISDIRNNMTLMNIARQQMDDERDRELQSRFRSMEDDISDIRNNMTLMNIARELMDNDRYRKLQSRLQSMVDTILVSEKVASERDREVQSRLRSIEESIEDKISDIYRDLRNNMTTFMTTISDRIDEHLIKAQTIPVKPDITTVPIINTDCTTVPKSGVYTLYLEVIMSSVNVYCDQDTDGGGWIVFMRRQDGAVNFDRSWLDYKHGFGSPDGEFWAGNKLLHKLTKTRPMQLRIDMEDFDGNTAFAMYEEFKVGAEEDKYRLHVREYSGTAGDSLIDTRFLMGKHLGMQFSTFDSDNDRSRSNCARFYKGGWWYNSCFAACLNGPYSHDKNIRTWKGIIWSSWLELDEALKRVEMKIR